MNFSIFFFFEEAKMNYITSTKGAFLSTKRTKGRTTELSQYLQKLLVQS